MVETVNYWKFLAGTGLFLYGMLQLEYSLKELAGKKFKLFFKKYTSNRFLAILNGALATALLQSSSVVLLLVIAFAGAGLISLSNSLGIILGANLGTTVTGWLVSLIGFKIDTQASVLPMIAIGSLGLVFTSRRFLFYHFFVFIISLGLLFMGLGFMKDSLVDIAQNMPIADLQKYGHLAFFLFGLIVTSIIHSSSAMMTIALTALFSNIIGLENAVYMIIGADLGTTTTALFASLKGTPVKKRVGLAHFLFNFITAIGTLLLVTPLLYFVQNVLAIEDKLFALSAFHTTFNFFGMLLFIPFLGLFEKLLNHFFNNDQHRVCHYIHKVGTEVPEASLEATKLELTHFIKHVYSFNSKIIGIKPKQEEDFLKLLIQQQDTLSRYESIKVTEMEVLEYLSQLQIEKLETSESNTINNFIATLRYGVQSAKSIKDIEHNFIDFDKSVDPLTEHFYTQIKMYNLPILNKIKNIIEFQNPVSQNEEMDEILIENEKTHQHINEWIYQSIQKFKTSDDQFATFLNVNNEVRHSNKSLINAIKEFTHNQS